MILIGGAGATITEDDNVRVTGAVRNFDAAAFEREYGREVFEDDIYDPWVDESVLVASQVTELSSSG